jgi:hypothetical protein
MSAEKLYDQVAYKAYELYEQRGEEHGHDLDDWLAAERLVPSAVITPPVELAAAHRTWPVIWFWCKSIGSVWDAR